MGKNIIERDEKSFTAETAGTETAGRAETAGTAGTAGTTESRRSENTTAESTRTGSTGAGSAGTDKTEKEKPVKVSLVNGELKEEKPKPKKRTPKKKKQTVDSNSIAMIISSASGIVASRKGFEIWALDENEVNSLSEPIANMLEKSGMLEKVGEHSDGIALAMAVMGIVGVRLPFLIAQAEENKKKKLEQRQVLKNARKVEQRIEDKKPKDNSGKTDGTNADNVSDNNKNSIENLYAVIG